MFWPEDELHISPVDGFFQGAGYKSWEVIFGLSDFLHKQHIGGFDLMTYLKHNLSFPGLPTSIETSKLEAPEFCVATFHSCLFNLALPKIE